MGVFISKANLQQMKLFFGAYKLLRHINVFCYEAAGHCERLGRFYEFVHYNCF